MNHKHFQAIDVKYILRIIFDKPFDLNIKVRVLIKFIDPDDGLVIKLSGLQD